MAFLRLYFEAVFMLCHDCCTFHMLIDVGRSQVPKLRL